MNFLQSLFNPQRSPSMPFNPAGAPPMPEMGGNLQRMTEGAPNSSRAMEILQAIGGSPATPPVQMPQPAQMQENPAQPPKRPKRSFLDIVGGMADAVATIGGGQAMYQPTLDAREDRARQIDLEEMQNRLREQQLQIGGQTLEANEGELGDTARARAANALGSLASNPDAAASWPQIAAAAGLDEQMTAQLGGLIEQGISPQVLAQSLGYAPPKQGSQAKELQVYSMLQQEDPELAKAYLQSIANPDSMSEYQRAQLQIGLAGLGLRQQESEFDRNISEREISLKEEKAATGGADLTPKDRSAITQKLKFMPVAQQQYQRVQQLHEQMMQEGTFGRGGIGGLLPGPLAGGRAEEFDKAVGALRKSILAMTRVPGVGAMSNYETMLDEASLPSRWGQDEGRTEAINNIGMLLQNYEQGYADMLGSAPVPARAAPRGNAPAPNRAAPRSAAPAGPRRSVRPADDPVSRAREEARRRGLR